MRLFFCCVCLLIFDAATLFSAENKWTFEQGSVWSRVPQTITMEQGKGYIHVKHTGEQDWAFSAGQRIPVKPGEIYELNADLAVKTSDSRKAEISVVTRDANGETLHWSFASTETGDTKGKTVTLHTQFLIPRNVETIEPRLTGYDACECRFRNFTMKKTGALELPEANKVVSLENSFLKLDFSAQSEAFSVTDKRTGRCWRQDSIDGGIVTGIRSISKNELEFKFVSAQQFMEVAARITLEADRAEFVVDVDADHEKLLSKSLYFPAPFFTQVGDRMILPVNEGISFPVEEQHRIWDMIAYGGHGICMPFWGISDEKSGAAQMAILETPDDSKISIQPGKEKRYQVGPVWESSMKKFRYPRKVRYIFFDKGNHVTMCKRYRDYAKATGLFAPFTEKVKKNPNIDLLIGAANIWYWERDKLAMLRELKAAGMDRILWSSGGSAEDLTAMNKIENVLTSRYDIYQDIMAPEKRDEVRYWHQDWVNEAWPNDINWTSPDGTWRRGWEVEVKEEGKPMVPCAVICDSKAIPYAKERISKELQTKPYRARFIDTTVAAPWFECYHPDHPMTRSDSKRHKMQLLELIKEDFGLVCGSETGHDASVPYCDFYEGMMSLGPWRSNDSGRNMRDILDEVPSQIEIYQVGEKYRLPLWELVYHDCVVAYWYWGDYNNKLPKVWKKRDLFNALYGVPPMYMFSRQNWNENKERFVESYKIAEPVSRLTGYSEMTDHRILSEDRSVQQTEFANGVQVTVNFGEKPFKMSDGTEIPAGDVRIKN